MSIYQKDAITRLRAAMRGRGISHYLVTSSDYHASEYVSDFFKSTEFLTGCTSDNVVLIIEEAAAHLWTDGRYFISAASELEGTGVELMRMGEPGVPTVEAYLRESLAAAGRTGAGVAAAKCRETGAEAAAAEGAGRKAGSTGEAAGNQPGAARAALAYDGRCVTAKSGLKFRRIAESAGARLVGDAALIDDIWADRPDLPSHPVRVLSDELCGLSYKEKLDELRADLKKAGADHTVISSLCDIMWLLNIRGGDVEHNPVALSYLFVTPDAVTLFIQESELTAEFEAYAAGNGIALKPYGEVFDALRAYEFPAGSRVLFDSGASSDAMWGLLKERTAVLDRKNPTELRKARKNETEIANIRKYYLLDSVAVCKFIYEVKNREAGLWRTVADASGSGGPAGAASDSGSDKSDMVGAGAPALTEEAAVGGPAKSGAPALTEMAAARRLDALRSEIPGFFDLSFPTIPAYGANAAMAHYSPEGEGAAVGDEGFLLVDSGGQYLGATTDVTRTIAVGPLTDEMKRDFTLVAAGHFRLMNAIFKAGTTGVQLDLLAREPLYKYGLDFNHGTGHGIGYILNVHEGPQRIGPSRPGVVSAPMEEGMVTSDEPGIYREGEYGIRTESILLAVPHGETAFGKFLAFECLTWAPIDRDAIDPAYLSGEDLAALNEYHRLVYEKIAPHLNEEERAWLKEATAPVS